MPLQTLEYRSAVRPPVQTHVYFLIDAFVEFLLSELSPPREHKILTNHYCNPVTPGPFILFNIEQLTRPKILDEVVARASQSDIVEVWDYSAVNVEILRERGISAKHVPVKTTPQRIEQYRQLLNSQPKLYDVGFCGVVPDRRMNLLQQMGEKGLRVLLLSNVYGKERDIQLARCKFQVNIHQTDDHKVFESVRCDPWLSAGQPILSEIGLDFDLRCHNAWYNEIVEAAVKLKAELDTK